MNIISTKNGNQSPIPNSRLTEENITRSAELIYDALGQKEHLPRLSDVSGRSLGNLSLEDAYRIQTALVKLLCDKHDDRLIGVKAGVTTRTGQSKLRINEPLAGPLLQNGRMHSGQTITADPGYLFVEPEIGYIISSDIDHEIDTIDDLEPFIKDIVPILELPRIHFPESYKAIEIILSLVNSYRVVVGDPLTFTEKTTLADKIIVLNQQQLTINGPGDHCPDYGHGRNSCQGQEKALLWLVNHGVKTRGKLSEGDLLITGTLLGKKSAEIGEWHLTFGEMGSVRVTIVEGE